MKAPVKKALSYSLSFVLGFGLLGGVLYYVGWRSILTQISALRWEGILAVTGDVLLPVCAWVLSWWVILRAYGIRLSLARTTGARLSGYAVSYLTPSLYLGGEPIRAFMVTPHTEAPTTRIFATIVVERFLGGLSMLIFICIGAFYALVSPQIAPNQKNLVVAGVAFISFWIIVGLVNFAGNFKWISHLIRMLRIPFSRWRKGLVNAADKVSETEDEIYNAFRLHWRGTLVAFALQVAANFFIYMRPQVFFHFSAGTTFNFAQLSLLFTLNIVLSFFLWITPGGLGTSEAALIGIFQLVNIGKEGAVAFSLMFKFVELLIVIAGMFYLLNKGVSHFLARRKRPVQSYREPFPARGENEETAKRPLR